MFRPPSLLVSQIVPTAAVLPQGSRDFYFRAERASLPLHAPDMLTVRIQVIDGTRTFTLLDSQPCRLLILPSCYSSYGALNFYPGGTFTHCSCQPSLDAHFTGHIARAVSIPVMADIDTGGGNALNAAFITERLLEMGVAGVNIEDQVFPKRCGHMEL